MEGGDFVGLVAIICLFVILPGMAMFFAYLSRRRKHDDERDTRGVNIDLIQVAERMERRVDALEKILDAEAPGWRSRHHG